MKKLTAICALSLAVPAMGELVTNGGFEAGTGNDADNWNQLEIFGGNQGAAASASRIGPGFGGLTPFEGSSYMSLTVNGAPDYGPVAEIQQQTSVGGVIGGTEYDFSFMGAGFAGPGAVAFYEVLWFDGDGSNGGGPQGSATGLQTWTLTENWEMQGMNGLIAPDGADSVLIQIRLVTGAFDGAGGYAGIDAVSMTAIPAPGALALLGLAGIANRRRRD